MATDFRQFLFFEMAHAILQIYNYKNETMKNHLTAFLLFSSLLLIVSPSFSQIRKIPAEVTEAMKEKYPDAENISWKDKLTSFAASFEMNQEKYEARFSDKGEWKSTEKEINETDLKEEIKDGLEKSKYASWTIQNIYSIELPDDVMQYRILVAKNDIQKKNLLFNSDGRLLRDNITIK